MRDNDTGRVEDVNGLIDSFEQMQKSLLIHYGPAPYRADFASGRHPPVLAQARIGAISR